MGRKDGGYSMRCSQRLVRKTIYLLQNNLLVVISLCDEAMHFDTLSWVTINDPFAAWDVVEDRPELDTYKNYMVLPYEPP